MIKCRPDIDFVECVNVVLTIRVKGEGEGPSAKLGQVSLLVIDPPQSN